MKRRLLCTFFALAMVCGIVPFSSLADVVIGTMGISYVQIDGLDMPIVGELNMSAYENSKHKFVTSGDIIPAVPCFINIQGGTAYNAAGEVITEAMPGDTVTLVADEPDFGWKFDMWQIMGDTDAELANANASTTTFVMPDSDIIIFSGYTEAEKVDVEQLTITIKGYIVGANFKCLQPEVTGGAEIITNSTNNLDYIILSDRSGNPGDVLTSGNIDQGTNYWFGLILAPEFGYTLDNLTVSQITCAKADTITIGTNTNNETVLLIRMKAAIMSLDGPQTISITGGTAYNNLTAVTRAYSGLTIRLKPAVAPDGQFFSHWEVVSGGVTLLEDEEGYYFTMGSQAVSISAVYKDYINFVELSVQEPVNTMRPSFHVSVPADAGYEVDIEAQEEYFVNGVAWYDETTETYLTAADTFEYGHAYQLKVLLKTKSGEQFSQIEYTMGKINEVYDADRTDYYGNSAETLMVNALFAVYEVEGPVKSWNVSLQDDIAVNFVMSLGSEDRVTINGNAVEPVANGDGTSTITVHLAAAQMTDELWIDINGTVMSKSYSVRKYADVILANDSYAEYHDLVKYMLAYGGAAQTYFDYNTENPANDGIAVHIKNPDALLVSMNVSDNLSSLNFYGASLLFRNRIAVRFYFAGEVTGISFMYNGDSYQPVLGDNGLYYIEITGITPQALGDALTVIVSDGADILRVTYSPLAYMIRMYEKTSSSDTTKVLMQALYGYYQAAVAYTAK